jgi:hypothetical protein
MSVLERNITVSLTLLTCFIHFHNVYIYITVDFNFVYSRMCDLLIYSVIGSTQ